MQLFFFFFFLNYWNLQLFFSSPFRHQILQRFVLVMVKTQTEQMMRSKKKKELKNRKRINLKKIAEDEEENEVFALCIGYEFVYNCVYTVCLYYVCVCLCVSVCICMCL